MLISGFLENHTNMYVKTAYLELRSLSTIYTLSESIDVKMEEL